MNNRTRVDISILHRIYTCKFFYFLETTLILQLLRDNLTVRLLLIFGGIYFAENFFLCVVMDPKCTWCQWYQISRNRSLNLFFLLIFLYNLHTYACQWCSVLFWNMLCARSMLTAIYSQFLYCILIWSIWNILQDQDISILQIHTGGSSQRLMLWSWKCFVFSFR